MLHDEANKQLSRPKIQNVAVLELLAQSARAVD